MSIEKATKEIAKAISDILWDESERFNEGRPTVLTYEEHMQIESIYFRLIGVG